MDQPDIRVEAMEVLRTLTERLVLTPDETSPNGLAIELFGDPATIMNLASSTGQMPGKSAALGAKKNPREAGASEAFGASSYGRASWPEQSPASHQAASSAEPHA